MKNIIRKILKEDRRQMFLDKIVHVMKNDFPFFKNMTDYGFNDTLSDDEYRYIFKKIFGETARRRGNKLFNKNNDELYFEKSDGFWEKTEYDDNGNEIYHENYNGFWEKWEYDERGNVIYYENFEGDWKKSKFDDNGNLLYEENSEGWWVKREYDENGRIIYYEDSTGLKTDNR